MRYPPVSVGGRRTMGRSRCVWLLSRLRRHGFPGSTSISHDSGTDGRPADRDCPVPRGRMARRANGEPGHAGRRRPSDGAQGHGGAGRDGRAARRDRHQGRVHGRGLDRDHRHRRRARPVHLGAPQGPRRQGPEPPLRRDHPQARLPTDRARRVRRRRGGADDGAGARRSRRSDHRPRCAPPGPSQADPPRGARVGIGRCGRRRDWRRVAYRAGTEGVRPLAAQPVTSSPGDERDPDLSPDGERVAFAWDGGDTTSRQFDIYVQASEGGTPLAPDEPSRERPEPGVEP